MARLDRTHKGAGYTKAVEAACEGFNIWGMGWCTALPEEFVVRGRRAACLVRLLSHD